MCQAFLHGAFGGSAQARLQFASTPWGQVPSPHGETVPFPNASLLYFYATLPLVAENQPSTVGAWGLFLSAAVCIKVPSD